MNQQHYKNKVSHYGISNTRLRKILSLIGDVSQKRILDAGCARGYLGVKFKSMGAHVIGLDVSPSSVEEASRVLDGAYVADLEKPWPSEVAPESFDIVIAGEIVEHFFDPVVVLQQAHKALKPGGFIIVTTPNFMTWTNRIKFLFGQFKYSDQGMFDFGHVRWFTHSYLHEVLEKSGFELEAENNIIFPGKLTKLLRFWPSLFAFQFVVRAKKSLRPIL